MAKIEKTDLPLGRRETRKRERRAAILAVAREAFLTNGYAATSMSGLLETLGGSKSTLWGYFPSKEDLFAAVLEDAAESLHSQLETTLVSEAQLEQGIRNFARAFVTTIETPDALAVWRLIVAEGERFPELGRLFYERAGSFPERILADFLKTFVGDELRDEDPNEMAATLIGLCASRIHQRLFGIAERGDKGCEATAMLSAEVFLRAYRR